MARTRSRVVRRTPTRVKTQRPRKQRLRAIRARAAPDHFLQCVYGPVNTPSHGAGAPDGSVEPSVVIDHRQVVTIKPDANGNVLFALVPSPYGAVALAAGKASVTVNACDYTTVPTYQTPVSEIVEGYCNQPEKEGDLESMYPLIPFKESLRSSGSPRFAQKTGLEATKFRVLTSQAQADFTGSMMENSGSAVTAKLSHHMYEDRPFIDVEGAADPAYNFISGSRLVQAPPSSYTDVSALPGANVFPARQSVMMINAPQSFDYQEMREQWVPFMASSISPKNTGTVIFSGYQKAMGSAWDGKFVDPVPGFGYSTVTYYAASGLAPSAAITVEVRTCVEYTLAFSSPAARFTSLPAQEKPAVIRAAKEIGRSIPSSFPVTPHVESSGWLSNALGWYGGTMSKIIGGVYSAAGQAMRNIGPIGSVVGPGVSALGGQLSQLALTG